MASVTDGQVEAAKRRLRAYARGRAGDWTAAVREAVEAALEAGEAVGIVAGVPRRTAPSLPGVVAAAPRDPASAPLAHRAFDGLSPPVTVSVATTESGKRAEARRAAAQRMADFARRGGA